MHAVVDFLAPVRLLFQRVGAHIDHLGRLVVATNSSRFDGRCIDFLPASTNLSRLGGRCIDFLPATMM